MPSGCAVPDGSSANDVAGLRIHALAFIVNPTTRIHTAHCTQRRMLIMLSSFCRDLKAMVHLQRARGRRTRTLYTTAMCPTQYPDPTLIGAASEKSPGSPPLCQKRGKIYNAGGLSLPPHHRQHIRLEEALDDEHESDGRNQQQERSDRSDLVIAAHACVEHQQGQRDDVGDADEIGAGELV